MKPQEARKRRPDVPRQDVSAEGIAPEGVNPVRMNTGTVGIIGVDLRLACPMCGSDGLVRTDRRLVDRLLSALTPVRRFRCSNVLCGYEGNVRLPSPMEQLVRKIQAIDGCTRDEAQSQIEELARSFEARGYGDTGAHPDEAEELIRSRRPARRPS